MHVCVNSVVRRTFLALSILSLAFTLSFATQATAAAGKPPGNFPAVIPLPNGFQPEGIVIGRGTTFYVGSLANGALYRGDLRTGEGAVFAPGEPGRVTVGLGYDRRSNFVFAAGGPTGNAYVFDGDSGALLITYTLAAAGNFINDVVVTRDAAYFTNSNQAVFHRVPLGERGALPDQSAVQTIPLGGDFVLQAGFNTNGIDATPNGKWLIIVQSNTGFLYRVDPNSGTATRIDLGGETLTAGDGILLDGKTLYVVRNQLNQIAVVRLNNDLTADTLVRTISDPAFRVPTTIDEFGHALYAVNARFGTPPTPDTEYEVVRVEKK
ncbi:MAG: superoxide dismutase [Chloroflexi bacterium]|nr:superoxide dismutase [Chloroflexota bacterium]